MWHVLQAALVFLMSTDMPGQNTDCSARRVIPVTPWWAACRTWSTLGLADGGITVLSLYINTPSYTVSPDLEVQYCWSSGGRSLLLSGKVVWTMLASDCRLGSLVVSLLISSHVTGPTSLARLVRKCVSESSRRGVAGWLGGDTASDEARRPMRCCLTLC